MISDKMQHMTEEELIAEYGPMVYRIAVSYLRSSFDADDVFSETFYRYFRKKRTFENEEHRKAWLIKVTINCAKDFIRNRISTIAPEEINASEETNPEYSFLKESIESLPGDESAILYMFYYEDLSTAQIAAILEISPEAARKRLSRVREKLKDILC